jgi:hypothetical protein
VDFDLDKLISEVMASVTPVLAAVVIAEEEIEAAQKEHGEPIGPGDGPIWNSFLLLRPTHPCMEQEFIYRAHCRELLDRRAKGEDTRPGMSVEVVLGLSEASKHAPLTSSGAGLYLKLFRQCFPEKSQRLFDEINRDVEDYERLFGQKMAEDEAMCRQMTAQRWRTQ